MIKVRVDKNENILLPSSNYNKIIKKGDILTGKILDIRGKMVFLHITGLGTLKALSNTEVKPYLGKEIRFVVESFNNKILKIKPDIKNEVFDQGASFKKEEYADNVFSQFNIEKTPLNEEFVKSLIEYNVKLNEENLIQGIGLIKSIKNILSKDNEYNSTVKYFLEDKGIELLPKVVAFFIKHNIKPTFNNIVYFIELNTDLELFSKDYEILKDFINKEFTNYFKNIIISSEASQSIIEKSKAIYFYHIKQILKFAKDEKHKSGKEIYSTIRRFEEKLELIKELNNNLTFIFLPIDLRKDINSIIALVKKKRHKYDYQDAINVFINLKTKNLGKVEISINVINTDMNIVFSNLNEEDRKYFITKEEDLKSVLKYMGYNVTSVKYVDKKALNILDTLAVNPNPLYCLDIRV